MLLLMKWRSPIFVCCMLGLVMKGRVTEKRWELGKKNRRENTEVGRLTFLPSFSKGSKAVSSSENISEKDSEAPRILIINILKKSNICSAITVF